ncbi:ABC transporter ATP-binding protein [Patulibacter defluvii]|uniref:ABC transporter ATP-binding protein n=1 Tax=Patulibacter defluvii TaxID=3095358 RepID=UPI002A760159|nr:ABC transporter ATP-binding protein [Patulibacter sp. DM4]
MSEPLLRIRDLTITSRLGGAPRTIARGVDLEVAAGQALAIVGESGSGKSISARAVVGLLPRGVDATGEVRYRGRDLLTLGPRELTAVRGSEVALLFQDPFTMLDPLMRCGAQITETLRDDRGRRPSRAARRDEAVRRLAEVGIDDPAVADAYPFQLSGGMRQRVGIAAALAGDPRLLIADEPSTALDATTQREILARIAELQRSRGMALILITHDLRVAFSVCDRIAVLYAGSVLEEGPAAAIEAAPMHPYTLGLLRTEPPVDRRLAALPVIAGGVPEPDDVRDACAFAARCAWATERCRTSRPATVALDGRRSACARIDEIEAELRATPRREPGVAVAPPAPAPAVPLVRVEGLGKRFGDGAGGGRRVAALDDVALHVAANEVVGLVGESGSGKTTLGRLLLGLERPTAGRIVIDGIDVTDPAGLAGEQRRQVRRAVQMVFQDPYSTLNPARTVGATLREAVTVHQPRGGDPRARVAALLEQVGLPAAYAERKPVALSGGERQRVAIARALAADPRLIVCDEAVSALDVSVQAQILNLLAELRRDRGLSYLFVTHDLAVVRQIADRVYVLRRGRLVEEGPCADVLDRPRDPYTQRLIASIPSGERSWLAAEPAPADAVATR